ncbi:MAG TPA: hypothetical protein VED40_12405 [Azospirillaceae bacterium]|nr:hypothetical protein [Azospirillaceae bacterium]
MPHATRRRLTPSWSIAACLMLAGAVGTDVAAETTKRGVLRVEVQVEGQESWKRLGDWRQGEIRDRFLTEIPVMAEGDLDEINSLDPASLQAAADKAMRAQGGVQPYAGLMNDPAKVAQLQARAEACKQDVACLQALATEISAVSAHKPSAAPAEEEEEATPRYRRYFAEQGCGGVAEASIDRKGNSKMADVAGMQPTTDSVKGAGKLTGARLDLVCLGTQLVVDEVAGTLYIADWAPPAIEAKSRLHMPPDGVQESTDTTGPMPGVAEWVGKTLKHAPLKGSSSTVLTTPAEASENSQQGASTRTLKVTLTWSFTAR